MDTESIDLIYLDPPFNSKKQWEAPIGSTTAAAVLACARPHTHARYLAVRMWIVATPQSEESILAVSPAKAGALGDAAVDGFDFDVALV